MVKKILILFPILIVLCLFLFNTGIINAQTSQNSINPHSLPLNTTPDVPQNLHTYTQASFIEILATAVCATSGVDILSPNGKCIGLDLNSKKLTYVQNSGGLAGALGGLIGGAFNLPVSSFQYGNYLASNFGITRPTYAQSAAEICAGLPDEGQCISEQNNKAKTGGFGQGVGFVGLTPVLQIWITFRNLTYLVFVLVFILLGLGIMFRLNIDARTVMTIQNQIPKIIIALILITFSYAIAGFLIDMMYVLMYLVIYIFHNNHLVTITQIDKNPFEAIGGFGGVNGIVEPAAKSIGGAFTGIFDGNLGGGLGKILTRVVGSIMAGSAGAGIGKLIGSTAGLALGTAAAVAAIPTGGLSLALIPVVMTGAATGGLAGGTIGSLIGGGVGAGVGFAAAGSILNVIAFIIAYLIITIAVFQSLFRVWVALIKAYVFIILDVIFAPFWILGGIIPGVGGGIGPWLRSIIANLAGFPVVLILFMIGRTIQEQVTISPGQNFVPPLIGNIGDNPISAMANIIGLGIILIMPEAINITKGALKAPEMKYTAAIGQALGAGKGVITKPFSGVGHELFGKDIMGAPKPGSQWLTRTLGGSKLAQVIAGGGLKDNTGGHQPILPNVTGKVKSGISGVRSTFSSKYREEQEKARKTAEQARIDREQAEREARERAERAEQALDIRNRRMIEAEARRTSGKTEADTTEESSSTG